MSVFRNTVALSLACVILSGCRSTPAPAPASMEAATLAAGTPVRLVLLKELESGVSEKGTEVPLMVVEDVRDGRGRVVLPKGTPARGRVTWSRREGTLSGLVNEPARLEFELEGTMAADGDPVALEAGPEEGEGELVKLTRANTGRTDMPERVAQAVERGDERALREVAAIFDEGSDGALQTPEGRERLAALAREAGLEQTERLLRGGEADKARRLLQEVRKGAALSALASGGSLLAVDALIELSELAGQVGNRLSRMLRGRNIKAYVGTSIEVRVARDVSVEL